MNAILAACGSNMRKLLRVLLWLVFNELERLKLLLMLLRSTAGIGRGPLSSSALELRSNVA